jgi:hypothetical protein
MNAVRHEFCDNNTLLKYYDSQDRIVEIAFITSGNGCTIQYDVSMERPDERIVRWDNGEVYRTWTEDGKTKFVRLNDVQEWHY